MNKKVFEEKAETDYGYGKPTDCNFFDWSNLLKESCSFNGEPSKCTKMCKKDCDKNRSECKNKNRRGLTGCVTCDWDNCKYLTEDEKTKVYHLEEMKDEVRDD